MTRKDYERAAALVRRLDANPEIAQAVVLDVIGVLADLFAADNPRFDRDRFIGACLKGES